MAYYPTDADLSAVRQRTKDIFVKIELLNKNYKIIDSLTANLITDSLNIDSTAKQRRRYSCNIHAADYSFLIGADKKIWIDKYVRIYYGIKPLRTAKIRWWLVGTFTYVDANYTYSGTDNTLALTCADLMADYDGTKNGVMNGYALTIPAGEDIRESVLALVKKAGITRYYIEDIGREIPYDLEYSDSVTYCDIWTDICELYDSWEFFFDVDGTFIWRQIPTGLSEPCQLSHSFIHPLVIDESVNNTFKEIYNVTEIWGKTLELENNDRYADTSAASNGVYAITLEGVGSLEDIDNLDRIAVKICSDSVGNDKMSINGLSAIPIVNDDGSVLEAGRLKGGAVYVFMYRRTLNGAVQNCLYLMGQYQAYGIYKETNPDCPFSVGNLGYEIPRRLNYEKLYSDDLCYNQAEYLTYQTTAMRDTVTLSLAAVIPWLDVNRKLEYTPNISGIPAQYMIQNISWSTLEGTMTLTLYRFLESFSYVKNKESSRERRNI